MYQKREPLWDKNQTGKRMHELIRKFWHDLKNISVIDKGKTKRLTDMSLKEFFDIVRRIKYRRDMKPIEIVSRPKHILNNSKLGMDCKKKAILIASFLKSKNIPYRLIASSNKPHGRIHHVFPQCRINDRWLNCDATYSKYRLFEPKMVTNAEILSA